jgi:hypothetical protein
MIKFPISIAKNLTNSKYNVTMSMSKGNVEQIMREMLAMDKTNRHTRGIGIAMFVLE